MKYKILETVNDYAGKPILNDGKPWMWKDVIISALNGMVKNEEMTADEKVKCFKLSMMAYQNDEVEYTAEDVTFILKRIQMLFAPIVVGRADEFFNKTGK